MGKKLIAIYPILYRARQYKAGDELPTQDAEMVKAWLEAHTAEWAGVNIMDGFVSGINSMHGSVVAAAASIAQSAAEDETGQQEPPEATATPVTAVAGIEGQSSTGEDGAMVGRVPATPEREKPKIGRASTRKAPAKPAAKKK